MRNLGDKPMDMLLTEMKNKRQMAGDKLESYLIKLFIPFSGLLSLCVTVSAGFTVVLLHGVTSHTHTFQSSRE